MFCFSLATVPPCNRAVHYMAMGLLLHVVMCVCAGDYESEGEGYDVDHATEELNREARDAEIHRENEEKRHELFIKVSPYVCLMPRLRSVLGPVPVHVNSVCIRSVTTPSAPHALQGAL